MSEPEATPPRRSTTHYLILAVAVVIFAGVAHWRSQREIPVPDVPLAKPIEAPATAAQAQKPADPRLVDTMQFTGAAAQAFDQLKAKFDAGKYVEAVEYADQLLANATIDAEFIKWLQTQMATLLTSAGWQRIKDNDCDAATIYLRRAEAVRTSVETNKGLAFCYHKLKNLLAADEQFRNYLAARPGDVQMQLLYADHLESDRRYSAAEKVLRHVAATEPEGTDDKLDRDLLTKRADAMRAKGAEDNNQVTINSEHVQVIYRPDEHGAAVNSILEVLESAISEYEEHLGIQPPRAPLEVILYPTDGFGKFAAGTPDWAQGIFDGRIRIPLSRASLKQYGFAETNKVLRHELFHALMATQTNGRQLPPWFNEGMAQRLECPIVSPCKTRMPLTPGGFLPDHVFKVPYTTFDALLASRVYMQSRYLIATLEREREGLNALREVINGLPASEEIDSDRLLAPAKTNFDQLRAQAEILWKSKTQI